MSNDLVMSIPTSVFKEVKNARYRGTLVVKLVDETTGDSVSVNGTTVAKAAPTKAAPAKGWSSYPTWQGRQIR